VSHTIVSDPLACQIRRTYASGADGRPLMSPRRRIYFSLVLLIALFSSACTATGNVSDESPRATSSATAAPVEGEDGATSSGEGVICDDPPPAAVALASTVSGEIVDPPRPVDYARCFAVDVPSGVGELVFELTGLTDALNLAVGYGSVSAVQTPGVAPYWRSGESETNDEIITVEAPEAGTYYVVVSSGTYRNESPFTLTIRGS